MIGKNAFMLGEIDVPIEKKNDILQVVNQMNVFQLLLVNKALSLVCFGFKIGIALDLLEFIKRRFSKLGSIKPSTISQPDLHD